MGRYISNASSYQDNELLLLKQGITKNHKEFLIAGTDTWTIDHDVIARVRVWGGGGGGGSFLDDNAGGAGGGAGGSAEAILRLKAGTYNITVGAGGAAGSRGGVGAGGGSSSFHTYITCSGGFGGEGSNGIAHRGGLGGSVTFNLNDFDGFLYTDGRRGGAGGSFVSGAYLLGAQGSAETSYRFCGGGERGEGESGGPASYTDYYRGAGFVQGGGGGGGYNPPFIYGSGHGAGTGGAGGRRNGPEGSAGNSGAVVIEWN